MTNVEVIKFTNNGTPNTSFMMSDKLVNGKIKKKSNMEVAFKLLITSTH